MKIRHLILVLSILGANLLGFAAPAQAQTMDCPNMEPTIASLRDCVEHAADVGHIDNAGVTRSLLTMLDQAQAALNRGQTEAAIRTLQAFIQYVDAQAGQQIDAEHAAHMAMHAQMVINALSQ